MARSLTATAHPDDARVQVTLDWTGSNLVTNPSFETNTTGWVTGSGTLVRSTAQSYTGSASGLYTTTAATPSSNYVYQNPAMAVVAGRTYTAQARVRMSTATPRALRLRLQFLDGSGVQVGTVAVGDTATIGSAWTRITATGTAPAGAVTARFFVVNNDASVVVGDAWHIDAAMLEEAATASDYLDGDTAGASWSGTAHASTSAVDPVATATVERVDDATGAVSPVRNAEPAALSGGRWTGGDFEAPFDRPIHYRTTIAGTVLVSGTVALDSSGRTWLRHPGQPSRNVELRPDGPPNLTRPIKQAVFDVLGRVAPVAVSMLRNSERGEIVVSTDTDAERVAMVAILADGSPLLLSTPEGYGLGSMYVAVGDVEERRPTRLVTEATRLFALPFVVVDRPAGPATGGAGLSWQAALDAYPDWQALAAAEGTWLGLAEGIG